MEYTDHILRKLPITWTICNGVCLKAGLEEPRSSEIILGDIILATVSISTATSKLQLQEDVAYTCVPIYYVHQVPITGKFIASSSTSTTVPKQKRKRNSPFLCVVLGLDRWVAAFSSKALPKKDFLVPGIKY